MEKNLREKQPKNKGKSISIAEAAERNDVTRQAIYVAIKHKKLKAYKENSRWKIDMKDLEEYKKSKYSRSKSTYNGELIFDKSKGLYSVNEVASMLKVPPQKIYYATRKKQLASSRRGAAWVLHIDDVNDYLSNHLSKEMQQKKKIKKAS